MTEYLAPEHRFRGRFREVEYMAVERQTEYETIYILRANMDDAEKTTVRERIENIVVEAGGHSIKFDDWGVRRLAYRIRDAVQAKHHEQGAYQYFRYLAPRTTVAEIERNLRILDPVLKYQTIKIEADLIPTDRLNQAAEEE